MGIQTIEKRDDKSRNPSILFFTNTLPSDNDINALKELKEKHNIRYPIHSMAFGHYNKLNSEMMYEISKLFNGMNLYIPEQTSIGTVFVNAIANILTTQALDTKLTLKFKDPSFIEKCQGWQIGDL